MEITGETRLLGLLGSPVSHSLSPRMHNAAFGRLGLDYVYLAFETTQESLSRVVAALRDMNVKGFNITMPLKKSVLPLLDGISPEARMIGCVNTVANEDGRLIGYNTDGLGYVRDLKEHGVSVRGARIALAGAGGAARSAAIQLALDGAAEIAVFNRTLEKAADIADAINKNIPGCRAEALCLEEGSLARRLEDADILVNATALGMRPHEDASVISSPGLLRRDLVVSDFIYEPSRTKLLRIAEEAGCRTLNGSGMLLYQGAEAFRIWTGMDMPVEYVRREVFRF